jgi:hypothetical protein
MFSNRITITAELGVVMSSTILRSADGQLAKHPALPAARAGTLSTRTSDTAGTLTLAAGHGVQTGAVLDVYWSGGRRYNVVAGVVVGNDVPISGGAGDSLPTVATSLTAAVQLEVDTDFEGDPLVAIGALCPQRAHVGFYAGTTLALSLDLVAGELWHWIDGGTAPNPLAGQAITHVVVTQAGTTETTFKLGVLHDATP